MSGIHLHQCRSLLYATLAALLMLFGLSARAADFSASVENNNGVVTLVFKSNVNTAWVNAHYNINGGGQQNVAMTYNSAKARFEYPVGASAGQTLNYAFTYDAGGPAYDSAWTAVVVPPPQDKVAAPVFSPAAGNYSSTQSVVVSSATTGATLLCSINGAAQVACPNPITVASNSTISAIATKAGLANSDSVNALYTIGTVQGPYTQDVADNASSATIWFAPNPASAWVDVHYSVNGGGQQNVRMNYATGRHEQVVAATPGAALAITYSFTYMTAAGAVDTPVFTWTRSSQVATPQFTPVTGTYVGSQTVTLTSATAGATIYYTLDGSAPGTGSRLYSGAFSQPQSATIKAIAVKSGMSNSNVASATLTITSKVATPAITPGAGSYTSAQTLAFSSATSGAAFCVTVDGSTPVKGVNCQPLPVIVSAPSTTVKVLASASGMADSDVASGVYQISCCALAPTISPAGGTYTGTQSIVLADATTGATIYYTLDGSTPSSVSTPYTGPIMLAAPGATVRAIAIKAGLAASSVTSATFVIVPDKALAPTFTPAGGAYTSAQDVHLASATAGASIYYSVNGGAQQLYSDAAPVHLSANSTISAVAKKSGMTDSNSASANYSFSTCTNCFGYGVMENGAVGKVWFAPDWTPATRIVHYKLTASNGAQSPQRDENIIFNATLNRWESPAITPIGTGDKIDYFFTYSAAAGGNVDSVWYHYVFCGDAPESATCPALVAKPLFSIPGGVYSSAQQLTLSLAPGVDSSAKIYYTLDGSAPGINSPLFLAGHPIAINTAMTVNAITVLPSKLQSRRASASFDIQKPCDQTPEGCAISPPVFSHAAGSYATVIGLNLLTTTTGATIHYTTDGSTPTRASPQFYGAIWLRNTALGSTTTVKALATKNGQDSAIVERTYTITANGESPWNGRTTFNVVNGTGGKYSDDQVYWLIIGIDWASKQYVHVDQAGNLVPMSLGDNVIPVPGRDVGYANYAISLAQAKSVTIPPIESARIYMSVGKPVLIQVNMNDLGKLAYAGPDLGNSTDPNLDVTFDFGEFNINQPRPQSDMPGIFVNTSRVDIFGFPLQLNVTGLDGYNATVGESLKETRDELFARYNLEVPAEFRSLAQAPYAPYRIMSPAHGTFDDGIDVKTHTQARPRGVNATYLDDYIESIWNQYKSQDLVLNLQNGWPTFTGRVGADNVLTFTDSAGTYRINGKPSTTEVMLGNGLLDDASGTGDKLAHDKQLQLQAQVCAALNRHVADQLFGKWWNGAYFYPAGGAANYFTKFWHVHSLNGLAYGFSYDDVGGHSPSIYTPSPVAVTYTIGK